MKVLRLIKGVTRRDRLRNVGIRRELGLTSIIEAVTRNRLRWNGHVQKMDEERLPWGSTRKKIDRKSQEKMDEGREGISWEERREVRGYGTAINVHGERQLEGLRGQSIDDWQASTKQLLGVKVRIVTNLFYCLNSPYSRSKEKKCHVEGERNLCSYSILYVHNLASVVSWYYSTLVPYIYKTHPL